MLRLLALLFILLPPAQAEMLGAADARHLLNRAGFGATPAEIAAYARLTRAEAVERLLAGAVTTARTAVPAELEAYLPPERVRSLTDEEKKALLRRQFELGLDLRGWWLEEMLHTPSPLTERMTLFWHNHFVSSQQKVKSARLMLDQNRLLRRHALGNFGVMLHEVAKDPAMIVYLDSATNRKEQPNENFAREVMELFTLGEGQYTEGDVKEAARAFTGWSIDPRTGTFKWRPFIHDRGEKTVLGRRGNFDGDDVLDILLAQPATAEFLTAKLWKEFVSPQPEPAEAARIARAFRDSGYEIKTALRALFLSEAFWAPGNRASLVKSPADLVVGTLRSLNIATDDALPFVFVMRQLGQDLFGPPNVKGWPGGEVWINSGTLLARKAFIERLWQGQEMRARRPEGSEFARAGLRAGPAQGVARLDEAGRQRMMRALEAIRFDLPAWQDELARLNLTPRAVLLPGEPEHDVADGGSRQILGLMLDPLYQLK